MRITAEKLSTAQPKPMFITVQTKNYISPVYISIVARDGGLKVQDYWLMGQVACSCRVVAVCTGHSLERSSKRSEPSLN